jgi:hypothetical protein
MVETSRMLGRTVPLTCLAALSALLVVPAACSGTESNDGSTVTMPGAGGDGTAGDGASASGGGGDAPNGSGGSAAGEQSAAGTPSGASAGMPSDGGAPAAAGAGADAAGTGSTDLGGAGACEPVVAEQALADGIHVAACSVIAYATNPPSSGQHYGTWADFGEYDFALPRGYWVHNLEHGAVVVTYHCPEGCDDELAAARAWLAGLAPDANCPSGTPRVLLVPDPELDVRWAASSWGFTLRSDCFDAEAFSEFYVNHAGQMPAPEWMLCGSGFDFRAEGTNTCGAK